ncbi:nucleoside transporter family [Exophiala viscosa]|uniref:nucleoside transporter family n=1 Tax=Exophiala viscosa TaxID=2486360 RepID=UPI002195F691|nr:nucleoside transporter family [Exophiala viscosa]
MATTRAPAASATSTEKSFEESHPKESGHPRAHAAPHDLLDVMEQGTVQVDEPKILGGWNVKLEKLFGVEARGIERVLEADKPPRATFADFVQIVLLWFSANLTLNNLTIGLLGPLVFELGLTDAMLVGTFGTIAGTLGTAYQSTWGPVSGNRTMVVARYTMGWWPSKICVLLNMVIMLGYGLVDCLIAGQLLSAVAGGSMSVIVGTIIAAVISLVVALFGIKLFHTYERYAFIPQILVLFILIGVAGPYFNAGSATVGAGTSVAVADRVSFFFLAASAPLAWCPAASDYFVYFPKNCARSKVFGSTLLGLGLSSVIMVLIGVGLGSGALVKSDWTDAYDVSAGALIVQALSPLGTFGHFCSVVLALGLIANNIPGTYSAALGFQLLGRWFRVIPRWIWVIVSVVIYTVCACAGRNNLFNIFEDFLALMGYWTIMWCTMTLEEELIFRRKIGYNWDDWNVPSHLPIGIAALIAFCIGWVGAVLCMYQVYFTGPIAKLVGYGIDLGFPVSAAWSGMFYPPLRYLELKHFKR